MAPITMPCHSDNQNTMPNSAATPTMPHHGNTHHAMLRQQPKHHAMPWQQPPWHAMATLTTQLHGNNQNTMPHCSNNQHHAIPWQHSHNALATPTMPHCSNTNNYKHQATMTIQTKPK